ncbi:MAG: 6,7-dimethyl-8-ribityllumazine synthase [Bdellovibrionales bacterium RBG_16_40_8]|nr:MAG: 6,7-dimethyl-8-ribityllumazine synthase [Bdellovibrionales bacterium RBG_16_40_8]
MSHALKCKINSSWKIGVVTSRFNDEITTKLLEGALNKLTELGMTTEQILSVSVPGAYEIPLAAKWLLEKECAGIIALGAVIRGETSHYDYVCSAVERGCTTLQLEYGSPVVFGVLTTDNESQAINRIGGLHGHKGEDAAAILIEMLNLKESLTTPKTKEKKGDRLQNNHNEFIS